LLWVVFFM